MGCWFLGGQNSNNFSDSDKFASNNKKFLLLQRTLKMLSWTIISLIKQSSSYIGAIESQMLIPSICWFLYWFNSSFYVREDNRIHHRLFLACFIRERSGLVLSFCYNNMLFRVDLCFLFSFCAVRFSSFVKSK